MFIMDDETFSKIAVNSSKQIAAVKQFASHRYLFDSLKSASDKFYHGIYGIRGIGKTVMMLQLAALREKPLYISADAKYLLKYDIYDIVNYAADRGYQDVFIDEIHTRVGWASDLKTLYDEGNAKVLFTGSSSIEIQKGTDISRRAIMHELRPASFREYLNIKKGTRIGPVKAEELFNGDTREKLATKHSKWATFLGEYYKYGGVLYEGIEAEYPKTVMNTLDKMITVDLASLREIDTNAINNIYKLLYEVASSGPYEASYSNVASYLGISKTTSIKFIDNLSKIGILMQLYPCKGNFRKEPKIFFRTPFRSALNSSTGVKTDIGAMREEFFVNHAEPKCYFKTNRGEKTPDFMFRDKIVEVGGTGKRDYQSADFLAVDGLSFTGNNIPLFLFGLLY